MPKTDRPHVICHMLPSIDGRIVTRGWKLKDATREYERTAATFDADAVEKSTARSWPRI